jgi:hypothetical protein
VGVWCVRGQKWKKNQAGRGGGRKKGEISQCKCVCDSRGVVVVESAALGVSVTTSFLSLRRTPNEYPPPFNAKGGAILFLMCQLFITQTYFF